MNAQFGPQQLIAGQTDDASSVYSVDIDGDGDMDVLSSSQGDNKIAWYENLGSGTFNSQQKIITTLAMGARHVFASDLDGDGDIDVLSAAKDGNHIAWYENLGGGSFGAQQVLYGINNAEHVHASDLDGDGDMDIIYAGGKSLGWIENLGGGVFGSASSVAAITLSEQATSVYTSDVDGDGDLDILGTFREPTAWPFLQDVVWCENLGGGSFGPMQTISSNASKANSVFSADLDGDGDEDILSASANDNKLAWYENLGGGTIGPQQTIATVLTAVCVYATDMDGDGDVDILLANGNSWSSISWFENLGAGSFSTQQIIFIGPINAYRFDYVYAEDIDGDGDKDILSASTADGTIGWYENFGGGSFGTRRPLTASAALAYYVQTSDLDGDGDLDVLSASIFDNEIAWYENLGQGVFGYQRELDDSLNNPSTVIGVDIDGDGDNDVLCGSGSDDKVGWYENLGGGNFGEQNIISDSADGVNSVHYSDLDLDGDMDVLSANQLEDVIAWYENLGGGIFGPENVITTNADLAYFVYSKDLDNDGDEDVLSASWTDNKIAWYENQGGGTFGTQQIITTQAIGADCVHSFDVDNDGDNDVISASGSDNKVAWYENLGGGNFGPQLIISMIPYGPFNLSSNDLDQDGDIDLLLAYDRDIAWFENLGNGTFGNLGVVSSITNAASSVHSADMDGDGDIDVLSSSTHDGKIAWYENHLLSPKQAIGQLFYDDNQNGIQDSLDAGLQIFSVQSTPQNVYSHIYSTGAYVMSFADSSGHHQISPVLPPNWGITSDSLMYSVTIDSTSYFRDSLDFGFYPDTLVNSLNIEFIGSFPRCNDTINYWIDFKNIGTTTPSGLIHLLLDDSITYLSSIIPADSVNGQNVYWHYDSLFYFTNQQINLQVIMPGLNSMGDTLINYVNVSVFDTLGNFTIVYTASDTLKQELFCAVDPNDKIAEPVGIDIPGYINSGTPRIEYTIRFQNTGNDTALTVIIYDQLDLDLNWQTFTPLASSHNMMVNMDQTGEVAFQFYNIMLPDSGADYLGSQGFVRYTIDLNPNLPAGRAIHNTARIHFDMNPAVITNTKLHTIEDCSEGIQYTIPNLNLCETDTLLGSATDNLSNTLFTWDVPNVYNSTGPNLNWIADTSGTFSLTLSISNEICNKDTTVSITVLPAIPVVNNNQVICQGDSLLIYGAYQNLAGIYYDSLQSINGCDSVLTTTLSINPIFLINQNDSICIGDSLLIYGTYQNASGLYYDSLQSINGCDSLLSTLLTVNPLPMISIASFNPDTLCDNGGVVALPIGTPVGGSYAGLGVVGGNFDPTAAGIGSHYVIYTYTDGNFCINDDSTMVTVKLCVGINEIQNNFGILIYPNPNTGQFTIEKPSDLSKEVKVKLLDATSKLILKKNIPISKQSVEVDFTSYSNGIYYLQLIVDEEVFVKQILKQ